MECNVWLAGTNDSHFGLFYCDIMGNIYPPVTSTLIMLQSDSRLCCHHLQSQPAFQFLIYDEFVSLCLLLILSSQLLISTSCSTLPPSSLNHLQSSCPKNRACFRFRPQLSWRRKTLKLSTLNWTHWVSQAQPRHPAVASLDVKKVKKIWASTKTQISVGVLKMFFSLSSGSWRKLFSGFASLSRI